MQDDKFNANHTKWGEYKCYDHNTYDECYCHSCWELEWYCIDWTIGLLFRIIVIHSNGISSGDMISYQITQSLSLYVCTNYSTWTCTDIASENVILLPDFGDAGDTMVLRNMSNNRLIINNSIIQHGVQIDIIMQILMILSLYLVMQLYQNEVKKLYLRKKKKQNIIHKCCQNFCCHFIVVEIDAHAFNVLVIFQTFENITLILNF